MKLVKFTNRLYGHLDGEYGLIREVGEHEYTTLKEAWTYWENEENIYFGPVPNHTSWQEINFDDLPWEYNEMELMINFFLTGKE